MQCKKVSRNKLIGVSSTHLDLAYDQEKLESFINRKFSKTSFAEQIQEKNAYFTIEKRSLLCDVLKRQYEHSKYTPTDLLTLLEKENTYTVTTGHQMCLFTGPLYFVLKILHTIRLTKELSKEYPNYNFIPVYWMASEDHDFDEIKSCNVFNQMVTWDTKQNGAVGRFNTNDLEDVKNEFKQFFANHPNSEIHKLIEELNGVNYSHAFRNFVHALFEELDLLIIDGDDPVLKELFVPVMKREIVDHFSEKAVLNKSKELADKGYSLQVNPRPVNLFYMKEGVRSRIEPRNGAFHIDNVGDFPIDSMIEKLDAHPERFSPNVVLRPVYQETILPNLAYIGGGGELSYWLQLKDVFDSVEVPYPILIIRNSIFWIDNNLLKKMEKINMSLEEVFSDMDQWKKDHVVEQEGDMLDFTDLDKRLKDLKEEISNSITAVDAGLDQYAGAETARLDKQIESIKAKLLKRSKSKHDETLKQVDSINNSLFPNGSWQERVVNLFSLSPDGDYKSTLRLIHDHLDPWNSDINLFYKTNS